MLSTILLSALSSTIVVRIVTEETFFSSFQTNYSFHLSELTNFVLVGLIVGIVSVIYIISLRYTKHFFDNLKVPQFVRNLFGALLIGCMLYFFSDYYLYNPTPDVITLGNYSAGHLYIISILVIILTSITIFTPGLMIGLTFGLALSKTFIHLGLPLLDVNTYALAGMAAMFAGFAIAPLSAALMIVEMTNQYNLLFPILISSLIASKISEIIVHDSIYHQNLDSLLSRDHLNDQ
jgi:CIC family chloride channel protein